MTRLCEGCYHEVAPGLATIRTTLRGNVLAKVYWCRTCRPLPMPEQSRRVIDGV